MPVLLRSGGITWVAWGSRKKEANRDFPSGGWVRLDSIEAYKWKPQHPGPVLIIVDQFMEKDKDDRSHWIELDKKMAIQGLFIGGTKRSAAGLCGDCRHTAGICLDT